MSQRGKQETIQAILLKTIQKFPDWADADIAELVGVTPEHVRQFRENHKAVS